MELREGDWGWLVAKRRLYDDRAGLGESLCPLLSLFCGHITVDVGVCMVVGVIVIRFVSGIEVKLPRMAAVEFNEARLGRDVLHAGQSLLGRCQRGDVH